MSIVAPTLVQPKNDLNRKIYNSRKLYNYDLYAMP